MSTFLYYNKTSQTHHLLFAREVLGSTYSWLSTIRSETPFLFSGILQADLADRMAKMLVSLPNDQVRPRRVLHCTRRAEISSRGEP
eukprot:1186696-Prorocentrum_minimum.AAC.2